MSYHHFRGVFAAFVICAWVAASASAVQKTAVWTGAGDGSTYGDALNWDIGEVPVNGSDTYVVVIPGSVNLSYNLIAAGTVDQLTLGSGSTLTISAARSLSVLDAAAISGTVTTTSGTFSAPHAASTLVGASAKITVAGTGVVTLGAAGYTSTGIQNGVIVSADGTGAAVNLSLVQTINDSSNFTFAQTRTIQALNNAAIDLSGLTQIHGGSGDDLTQLVESSGGSINLSSLATVNNNVKFVSDKAVFTLPSLVNAANMTFSFNAGYTLNLPLLTQQSAGAYTLGAGDTVNLNALTQLTGAGVSISDAGSVFNAPVLGNINNTTIKLSGGAQLAINIANYNGTGFTSGTFFSADGTGTLLNLASVQSIDSSANFTFAQTRTIAATNGGVVDLSNMTSMAGGTGDDLLDVVQTAGGVVKLDNLVSTTGRVRFTTDIDLTVAKLQNAQSLYFSMQPGSTLNLPMLISQTGGGYSVPAGGEVHAPLLASATGSSITVSDAAAVFDVPALANVDNGFLAVSGGAQLALPLVSNYIGTGFSSGTFMSVQGAGSLLNLSNLQTIDSAVNQTFVQTRTISATDGGVLDLSSVTTLKGGTGDDLLRVIVGSSGAIDLSSLHSVSVGNVQFDVDAEGTLELGDFTVTGNTTFNINDITSTVKVAGSLLLDSPAHFNVATGGGISVGGNFSFATTDETAYQSAGGILTLAGMGTFASPQYLEVGGLDAGLGDPGNNGNFGVGQLVIGTDAQATVVSLVDLIDNGNRSSPEALYLFGLGGPDGLMLRGGSTLVIDNIHVYAWVNGEWLLLNSLFGPSVTQIDFGAITNNPADAGYIAIPEPATLSLLALGGVALLRRRR